MYWMARRFVWRVQHALVEAYYWIKHRTWHPWNVVKIRTLGPDYNDPDETLLHAAFAVLSRYAETSDWRGISWESGEFQTKRVNDEIQALYDWWTKVRPNRESTAPPIDRSMDDLKVGTPEYDVHYENVYRPWMDAYMAWEDRCTQEDEDMLIRLAKIRSYLWT